MKKKKKENLRSLNQTSIEVIKLQFQKENLANMHVFRYFLILMVIKIDTNLETS